MADAVESFDVLIVDDDKAMAELTAIRLSRLLPRGTIQIETDPRTAHARLDSESIDCLVSDYDMPEWTGLELLARVRAERPNFPFILFTGKGSEEIASEAISAGVTDYLQKRTGSDRYEVLANRITNAIARSRAVTEARHLGRYKTVVDILEDPVYVTDESGHFVDVNEAFERLTGYERRALLGEHPSILLDDETVASVRTSVESFLDGLETSGETAGDGEVADGGETATPSELGEASETAKPAEATGPSDAGRVDHVGRAEYAAATRTTHEMSLRTASDETVHCEGTVALVLDEHGSFDGTVGIVNSVETRESATNQLRENNRKIEAIHGFAHTVGNCETIEEVCQRTVEAAERILAFDICYIGLREGEYLVPKASQNIEIPDPIHHTQGIAGRVHRSGESWIVDEMHADPDADPTDDAMRSGMTVAVGDLGVFQAASFTPDDFAERDIELTELLLSHVAEALKRVRSESELRAERDRVTALFENLPEPVAVCHATADGPIVDDVNSEFERVFGYSHEDIVGKNIDDYVLLSDEAAITLDETFYVGNTVQTEGRRQTKYGPNDFQITIIPVELDGFSSEGYVIYGDISEQKRRERELSRQNERLAEFTSLVTHDLRNPLNVAMGNLELAREDESFERLDTVTEALDRMESLIGEFLSLARQGRTVNEPVVVTLDVVVTQSWDTVETGPNVTLDVEQLGDIAADPERLRTMFENLFRNSVEHGDETTTVRVGKLSNGFYVEDDGPGIDADKREQVFDYGYSTDTEGTGFGLATVQRIVEAHGWTVVATESESGGARFEVHGVQSV